MGPEFLSGFLEFIGEKILEFFGRKFALFSVFLPKCHKKMILFRTNNISSYRKNRIFFCSEKIRNFTAKREFRGVQKKREIYGLKENIINFVLYKKNRFFRNYQKKQEFLVTKKKEEISGTFPET